MTIEEGPIVPTGEEEVFAWAFMIGYLGDIPDAMREAFADADDEDVDNYVAQMEDGACPSFIDPKIAYQWKRGYEAGVSTFCDHNGDNDE